MKRPNCGIAFLGDFWHARGSLKVCNGVGFIFFSPRFHTAEVNRRLGFGQSWRKDVALYSKYSTVFYVKIFVFFFFDFSLLRSSWCVPFRPKSVHGFIHSAPAAATLLKRVRTVQYSTLQYCRRLDLPRSIGQAGQSIFHFPTYVHVAGSLNGRNKPCPLAIIAGGGRLCVFVLTVRSSALLVVGVHQNTLVTLDISPPHVQAHPASGCPPPHPSPHMFSVRHLSRHDHVGVKNKMQQ